MVLAKDFWSGARFKTLLSQDYRERRLFFGGGGGQKGGNLKGSSKCRMVCGCFSHVDERVVTA